MSRISLKQLADSIGCDVSQLEEFINHEWLRPIDQDQFDDEDIARAFLIYEMREDFGVNDSAIPIILHLLDQLYYTRLQIRKLL